MKIHHIFYFTLLWELNATYLSFVRANGRGTAIILKISHHLKRFQYSNLKQLPPFKSHRIACVSRHHARGPSIIPPSLHVGTSVKILSGSY